MYFPDEDPARWPALTLKEILKLKPTAVWLGDDSVFTITCGTSWLTITANGNTLLRLRGRDSLRELQQLLGRCLDYAKNGQGPRPFDSTQTVSLHYSAHTRRYHITTGDWAGGQLEAVAVKQLADWLSLMLGDSDWYWHVGENSHLELHQANNQLVLATSRGDNLQTTFLCREWAQELKEALLATIAGQNKKTIDIGEGAPGVSLRFSSTICSELTINGVTLDLNSREMVCLSADISRWLGGKPAQKARAGC